MMICSFIHSYVNYSSLSAGEDDVALSAAPVYFAYGDALLCKAEVCMSVRR